MKFLSSLNKKSLRNKICLLRIDLNIAEADLCEIPGNKSGLARNAGVEADWRGYEYIHPRILAVLPTIEFLISKGAKIVILSHRGRPEINFKSKISHFYQNCGKQENLKNFTLKPFVKILSFLSSQPIRFINFDFEEKFNAPIIRKIIDGANENIFLLENLRFVSGEEKNNKKFSEQLASLGDFYVNDAFSASNRKNASVSAIVEFLPSFAGFNLEKEIKNLNQAMKNPKKPLIVILGGAKVSDKIKMIKNFFKKADYFLIGGGIANTFIAAQGLPIGNSLCDKNVNLRGLMCKFSRKIILPIDTIVYKRKILDIGPRTIKKYSKIIQGAKTIIWNGPMGYIEDEKFRKGNEGIIKAIIKSRAFAIIGGGESAPAFLKAKNRKLKVNVFFSTAGGAMLEYLAGNKLPGIMALNKNKK